MRVANPRRNKALRIIQAGAVVAAVGLIAAPTLAQGQRGGDEGARGRGQPGGDRGNFRGGFGGGGMMGGRFGGMMDPQMTSRDLTRYAEILALTPDQKEAAQALLEGYQLEVQTQRDQMQEQMAQARRDAEGGGGNWTAIRDSMQKFRTEKTKLDKTFMEDLKSLLGPEQETNWAAFERTHRREKGIGRGLISGERMDVIKLVDDLKVADSTRQELAPVLAQYEEELDRELKNREKVQDNLMTRMGEMNGDFGAMQRMVEEGREAAVRVREVNRKYARQIQGALPEEKQFEFVRAVKVASYPDIYRESYADRAIAAAAGFADLEAAQKESLDAIRTNYARDVAVLNDKLAAAQEEMEMNFNIERMREGRGGGELGDLRRQKRDLDRTTVENLRKLLTPAQQERLPEPEGREGRGGGRDGEDGERAPRRRGNEQRRGNDRT